MKRYRLTKRALISLSKAEQGFRRGLYRRGNACIALFGLEVVHGSFTEKEAKEVLRALQSHGLLGQDNAEGFWSRFACVADRHKNKAPFVECINDTDD